MRDNESIDPLAVAEGIQNEPIDPSLVEAARDRVAERLHLASAPGSRDVIDGCEDFARLVPAFVAGELPEARRLLVEDHTRTCIPCRRVLMAARSRGLTAAAPSVATGVNAAPSVAASVNAAPSVAASVNAAPTAFRPRRITSFRPLLIAAAVLLAVSGGLWFGLKARPMTGELARIQGVEGLVLLPNGQTLVRAASGSPITSSDVVRTGRGSRAVLRLTDGTRLEIAERSEISLSGRRDGLTVRLGRGQVIVEAAKQPAGKHLALVTPDCNVTVVGTVFAVTHGTRGSRVSVLEGEVKVASGSATQALHPGDQTSTAPGADAVPIANEVAWSEHQERYSKLLGEIASLKRELVRALPAPDVRFATRLLDAAPAGTVVYAAIPNIAADLLPSYRLIVAKIDGGGLLAEHVGPALRSPETRAHIEEALTLLGELGGQLGDEIALAVPRDGQRFLGPILYAEARRPRELADFLPGFVSRVNGASKKDVLRLASGTPADTGIVLSQEGDFLVMALGNPALEAFRGALAGKALAGSPFHARLAAAYQGGVHQVFAADLATLVADSVRGAGDGSKADMLARLGVLDADSLIVTRAVSGEIATSRAVLGFGRERRGVASWLAAPAAMGSLDFISPNASLAAAVVVKEPSLLVDDLFELVRTGSPDFDTKLAGVEKDLGIDIRKDLAASLGGEIAIAVDGPLLPKPAVEVIAEVYDPGRLQNALQKLAARADAALRTEGKPGLALETTVVSGRTFHALRLEGADPWLHWTYQDGFLVAAPDRVLVERALRTRSSGATLRTSADFVSRLPGNGPLDVSALIWQNLGPVLKTNATPSLGYAWGEKDRVVFSATGETGLLGLELPAFLSSFSHGARKPGS